ADRLQVFLAVDDDGDHAAAGGGLDAHLLGLPLQLLLELLRLLHHLADIHYLISSTSRISAGQTSGIACTPPSASARALRSPSGGGGDCGATAARSTVATAFGASGSAVPAARAVPTGTRWPATDSAIDSIQARRFSTCWRIGSCSGPNANTIRSFSISIFCA